MTQLLLAVDEFVVFDFETTGLSPWSGDEVIEIGAMKVFGSDIDMENTFHSLINPNRLIPEDATRVNGISNEMVAEAPKVDEIFPKFIEFVGDAKLVAQNARFDMGFVTKYLMQYSIKKNLEVYDTMSFSRRVFPGERRHNLDIIAQRLGLTIDPENRHRSIGDVILTAQAFVAMRDKLGDKSPSPEQYEV